MSTKGRKFAGCTVALATPFRDGELDEEALRARAREYRTALTSRWPNARVVFASKAFPATAVQRVMVEEGLGLDVAGGGEILSALRAGVDDPEHTVAVAREAVCTLLHAFVPEAT